MSDSNAGDNNDLNNLPDTNPFLAERLPNAAYVEYEGLGHEMPPPFCREIVDPILALITPE